MKDESDFYQLLEVPADSNLETIQKALIVISGKYHPSNEVTGDPWKYKRLQEAAEILKDEAGRKRYHKFMGWEEK